MEWFKWLIGGVTNAVGTIYDNIGAGLTSTVFWQNASGVWKAMNADLSALVRVKVATATEDDDAVTYKQFLTAAGGAIIKRQADCSSARPNNTAVRGMVVVSTAGDTCSIGDLLFDNGLDDAAKMERIPAVEGQLIFVTDALTGGAVTFDADTLYMWDSDNSMWQGQISESSGAIRDMAITIGTNASYSSDKVIRGNDKLRRCYLIISTGYSAGATIKVGHDGDDDVAMTTAQNVPQTEGVYDIWHYDTDWKATDAKAIVAISNTPAAGAGKIILWHSKPNS